jgi:hypothetical protein
VRVPDLGADGGHPGRDPDPVLDLPRHEADTAIIRRVKDDLTGWNLHRMV